MEGRIALLSLRAVISGTKHIYLHVHWDMMKHLIDVVHSWSRLRGRLIRPNECNAAQSAWQFFFLNLWLCGAYKSSLAKGPVATWS